MALVTRGAAGILGIACLFREEESETKMQALTAHAGAPFASNDRLRRVWTVDFNRKSLRFNRFCHGGKPLRLNAVGVLLFGYWKRSGWRCSSVLEEYDSQTNQKLISRKLDQDLCKFNGKTPAMDNSANNKSYLEARHQYRDYRILPCLWKFRNASVFMFIGLVFGLVLCHQAQAGIEVARVEETASWLGDVSDIKSGFLSGFLLIFFSEIGDKTFFIAALLASRKSNAAVFTGTFGALVAMTFISVFLGRTFHYIDGILPFSIGENELPIDDLAAVVLLVYFGVSTLIDAASMEGSKAEEEQQEAELAIAGVGSDSGELRSVANTALATFALVFVAEWGDKSFFSTVALSAASSPVGVVIGAIAGHGLATVLAVLGGSFLSTYISEKVIAYTGGVLFLIFALVTTTEIFSK